VSTFEIALEDALARMQVEGESLEAALSRYPEFAEQLKPLLLAAQGLKAAPQATPSAAFKQRGRSALLAHMAAHPRSGTHGLPLRLRYAAGLAAAVLALATATTVMAQGALPGQVLHPLKLASEAVWRAVHINPIYVDLEISNRRLTELIAVQGDPSRAPEALRAYAASLDRLKNDLALVPNKALSARDVITSQKEQLRGLLEASGTNADEFFTILPTLDELIEKNPNQVPVVIPSLQVPVVIPIIPTPSSSRSGESDGGEVIPNLAGEVLDSAKDVVDDLLQGLP
jgi:hypothetical protein